MKKSEMTKTQQKAFKNIKYAAYWLLGGLENTLYDEPDDSEEYKDAKAMLDNHSKLVKEVYEMATTEIYNEGCCCFNKRAVTQELREINFCGKEWLMQKCDERIIKEGY